MGLIMVEEWETSPILSSVTMKGVSSNSMSALLTDDD